MKGLRKPKRRRPRARQGFWRKRFQGKARVRKLVQIASRSLTFFVALVSMFQAIRSPKPNPPPPSISSCVSAENRYWSQSETSEKVRISNQVLLCCPPPNFSRFLLFSKPSGRTSKMARTVSSYVSAQTARKTLIEIPFLEKKLESKLRILKKTKGTQKRVQLILN